MSKTPITKKTSSSLATHWARLINDLEFATFIWPPRSEPIRRVIEFIRDEDLQKDVGLNTDKTIFAILDFKDEPIVPKGELYADILWELSRELREKGRLVEEFDALALLKHLEKEGYRVVLFVFGLDRMFLKGESSLFKEIALVYKRFDNISALCFLRIYPDENIKKTLTEEIAFTNTNVFYNPVYSRADSNQFISFIEEQWGMSATKTQREFILKHFAGKLGTIKNTLRMLRGNPKMSLQSLKTNPSIIDRGKLTLDAFHPDVLKVVKKIQKGNYVQMNAEKEVLEYLKNIGMIEVNGGSYTLYPEFLNDINLEDDDVERGAPIGKIDMKKLNSLLTFHEQRVLELLMQNEGDIVARDKVAEKMWESDVDERYSDWAIDQLMYRLRQRLSQGKVPLTIKTKRGQGFVLLSVD